MTNTAETEALDYQDRYPTPDPVYAGEVDLPGNELIERGLIEFLTGEPDDLAEALVDSIRSVRTYEDAGVLTRDRGLVVCLYDGTEYQVSIVRSR